MRVCESELLHVPDPALPARDPYPVAHEVAFKLVEHVHDYGHLAVHCPHTGYVKRAPQAVREGAFESAMHSWCNFPSPAANPASQA